MARREVSPRVQEGQVRLGFGRAVQLDRALHAHDGATGYDPGENVGQAVHLSGVVAANCAGAAGRYRSRLARHASAYAVSRAATRPCTLSAG